MDDSSKKPGIVRTWKPVEDSIEDSTDLDTDNFTDTMKSIGAGKIALDVSNEGSEPKSEQFVGQDKKNNRKDD